MSKAVTNTAASVRQRLSNLARERKEEFGLVLTRYALERVLYRIAESAHRNEFVLKGAMLFELWTKQRHRPTRDADFLATGGNSPARFVAIFKEVCEIAVPDDGLRFDTASVTAVTIKEGADYEGIRLTFSAQLDNARIPIQIDLGFGDAITPAPQMAEFPTLLDFPAPKLLTYPRETVIAEKFEAMVKLGIANSRMKDFYDIYTLSQEFSFEGKLLSEAVRNTFTRRETEIPVEYIPLAFTPDFYANNQKNKQWQAFCNKNRLYRDVVPLETVCRGISDFLMPILQRTVAHQFWSVGGPWKQ